MWVFHVNGVEYTIILFVSSISGKKKITVNKAAVYFNKFVLLLLKIKIQ